MPILQMAKNRRLILEDEFKTFYGELEELSKMILGLINSVDNLNTEKKVC